MLRTARTFGSLAPRRAPKGPPEPHYPPQPNGLMVVSSVQNTPGATIAKFVSDSSEKKVHPPEMVGENPKTPHTKILVVDVPVFATASHSCGNPDVHMDYVAWAKRCVGGPSRRLLIYSSSSGPSFRGAASWQATSTALKWVPRTNPILCVRYSVGQGRDKRFSPQ